MPYFHPVTYTLITIIFGLTLFLSLRNAIIPQNVPKSKSVVSKSLKGSSNPSILLDFEEANSKKTRAVIHVGVHKTGTTSIQYYAQQLKNELYQDRYEMPGVRPDELMQITPLAYCFYENRAKNKPCNKMMLYNAVKIAKRKRNILISAEAMSSPRFIMKDIPRLSNFTKNWDKVTIIVGYRRYYDWINSKHNQRSKKRINQELPILRDKMEFLRREVSDSFDIVQVVNMYQQTFEDVVVTNFHDQSKNLVERFFCDLIPNTNHTCPAIKKYLNESDLVLNPSIELDYIFLAMAVRDRGWINIKTVDELKETAKKIMEYRENSNLDFDIICPSEEILNILLERSLKAEKYLFPEFFSSSLGETDLRLDFQKKSKTALCEIDIETTLQRPEWKSFFDKIRLPI